MLLPDLAPLIAAHEKRVRRIKWQYRLRIALVLFVAAAPPVVMFLAAWSYQ